MHTFSPLPAKPLSASFRRALLPLLLIVGLAGALDLLHAADPSGWKVLSSPVEREFPQGFTLYEKPDLQSAQVKTVPGPVNVAIQVQLDAADGIFYLSDWGYAQYQQGKVFYWMHAGQSSSPSASADAPQSEPSLQVLPKPQTITIAAGFTVLGGPSLKAPVVKKVPGPVEINIAATLENAEGIFVLTDWSYQQYREGKTHFWIYAGPGKKQQETAEQTHTMISEVNRLLTELPPATIRAPGGYEVLDSPKPGAKVLKRVDASEDIRIAAFYQEGQDLYFVSDWSLERFRKEEKRPNWIRLLGDATVQEAAALVVRDCVLEQSLRNTFEDEMGFSREKVYVGRQLLALLEARYSKTHPDVIAMTARLAANEERSGNHAAARALAARYMASPSAADESAETAGVLKMLGRYSEADAIWEKLDAKEEAGHLAGDAIERAELKLLAGKPISDPLVRKVEKECTASGEGYQMTRLAEIYLRTQHPSDAVRMVRECMAGLKSSGQPDPEFREAMNRIEVLASLGRISALTGDTAEAKRAVTSAISLLPEKAFDSVYGRTGGALALAFVAEHLGLQQESQQLLEFVNNNTRWKIDLGLEHPDIGLLSSSIPVGAELNSHQVLDAVLDRVLKVLAETSRRLIRLDTKELKEGADAGSSSVTAASFVNCDWAANARSGKAMAASTLAFKGQLAARRLLEVQLNKAASMSAQGRALVATFRQLEDQWLSSWDDKEHEEIDALLRETSAQLGRLLGQNLDSHFSQNVTWQAVQGALPAHTVLVEIARCNEVTYAGALISSQGEPKYLEFGEADAINELIRRYRALLTEDTAALPPGTDFDKAFAEVNDALYKTLVQVVEPLLGSEVTDVILSPDDQLHFLNLAGLRGPDGQFWAQKRRIHHVSSGRDLLRPRTPGASSNKTVFFVGNPDFNNPAPGLALKNSRNKSGAAQQGPLLAGNLRAAWRSGFDHMQLPDLPGAEAEVRELQALFASQGWTVNAVAPALAVEDCVRKFGTTPPRILHLATHGFYFSDLTRKRESLFAGEASSGQEAILDPMRRAGLAFAGANTTISLWQQGLFPPEANDGLLMADEVAKLSLSGTYLVTLSACETGSGEALSGEGVSGLKLAFSQAGAENLLFTLWPIDDAATVQLMKSFYTRILQGEPASPALATIQAELLPALSKSHGLRSAVNLAAPFVITSSHAP